MSYYDDDDEYDDRDVREMVPSKLGLFSLLLAAASVVGIAIMIGYFIYLEEKTPGGVDSLPDESPQMTIAGLMVIGSGMLAFIGGVLAFLGLQRPRESKTMPVMGLIFNGLIVLGLGGLILLGIAAG